MLPNTDFEYLQSIADHVFPLMNDDYELAPLNEQQRVFVLVWALKGEIDNGGFFQFYGNSSGDYAQESVAALDAIDAGQTADLIRRANAIFPEGQPSREREVRNSQLGELSDSSASELEACDDEFYRLDEADSLDSKVLAYAREHDAELRVA